MENPKEPIKFAVIGGGGYVGFHIGLSLWRRGHSVILFDLNEPDPFWLEQAGLSPNDISERPLYLNNDIDKDKTKNYNYIKLLFGNVLDLGGLRKAIVGVKCVIHCVSYGMSGQEQMPQSWSKTEAINITGTENVLRVCLSEGVKGLVYTSSYNVVFGGQEIVNGDESLPYFPLHQHVDHYSRTKSIAEQLVLFSNGLRAGSSLISTPPLHTCALRLAGVFGLGEKRHLPRIVGTLGLARFKYGSTSAPGGGDTLQQFCTLRNVVQAHVKAAEQLLATPERLGGQAYFISDGEPVNTFRFLKPLTEALGYSEPKLKVPMWLIWFFVYLSQAAYSVVVKVGPSGFRFTPLLTPAEVYKTGVTHYFSCEKAKLHFNYEPERPNDISDVVQYYLLKSKGGKREGFSNVTGAVFVGVLFLFVVWLTFY